MRSNGGGKSPVSGRGRDVIFALAGIVVAWVIATTIAGASLVSDDVCATGCHVMRPYGTAHAGTAHNAVRCIDCHGAPGSLGPLANGLAMQRRVLALMREFEPSAFAFSDAACRRCHPAVGSATTVSRGIAVRHRDFLGEGCATCHGGTGHSISGRLYDVVEMADCMSCHSASSRETQACEVCHVPDSDREKLRHSNTWRVTHGAGWEKTHGMGDLRTCVSCHAPAYCARCHGVALPHPDTWPQEHGAAAVPEGATACESCHDRDWCMACHGIEMPHASGFLREHGPIASEAAGSACLRCHPQTACDTCHYQSAHPDIPGAPHFRGSDGGS